MLVHASKLIGTKILSVQAGGPIAEISNFIIDPDNLKIIAFKVSGPLIDSGNNILDVSSIREYSNYGMVIDGIEELVSSDDVVKIQKIIALNFNPINLKVETKKGSKLGHVIDFTVTPEDYMTQQLIVKRPTLKAFIDPELTIPRSEIVEVTDYKIIVKDEEKVIKARAAKEDFIPNFVNPFRESNPDFAPANTRDEKQD